ncbi:DUF4280 domain-containing protein [Mariniflexile ostreae]|uniref:DUF4280 domain-containing protein n=1 Tax=Mariniflexile ostreae TaxID=1520892 RepID=A0ABV5FDQ4_9FLAO
MGRINNWLENLLMGSDLVYTPPSHDQPPVSKEYEISKQQNEEARKEREKEEQAEDDLKMVIQGAKLQCAMCVTPIGDLMVNLDTPSIQDKKTATILEKDMTSLIFKGNCKKSPYSSSPCASVMQLGDWKHVGTSLVQDQPPLLLKSTIKCNYGGVDIKITDCGQRNEPEEINVVGAPVPVSEIIYVNGHFYNEDGTFEGKVDEEKGSGSVSDIYTCTKKEAKKDENGIEVITYKDFEILKEESNRITHSDFCYIAYIVRHEAGNNDLKELKCIAFTSYNRALKKKSTWKKLLATSYSSVPNKKELSENSNTEKDKLTRKALFSVLNGEDDITNGAEYWDGTDFLAWGNSETNPYNKLGQNKFDEYKFIEIPKDIYDDFVAANGSSARYSDRDNHPKTEDKGTQTSN